jgi:hypothetical protein
VHSCTSSPAGTALWSPKSWTPVIARAIPTPALVYSPLRSRPPRRIYSPLSHHFEDAAHGSIRGFSTLPPMGRMGRIILSSVLSIDETTMLFLYRAPTTPTFARTWPTSRP